MRVLARDAPGTGKFVEPERGGAVPGAGGRGGAERGRQRLPGRGVRSGRWGGFGNSAGGCRALQTCSMALNCTHRDGRSGKIYTYMYIFFYHDFKNLIAKYTTNHRVAHSTWAPCREYRLDLDKPLAKPSGRRWHRRQAPDSRLFWLLPTVSGKKRGFCWEARLVAVASDVMPASQANAGTYRGPLEERGCGWAGGPPPCPREACGSPGPGKREKLRGPFRPRAGGQGAQGRLATVWCSSRPGLLENFLPHKYSLVLLSDDIKVHVHHKRNCNNIENREEKWPERHH